MSSTTLQFVRAPAYDRVRLHAKRKARVLEGLSTERQVLKDIYKQHLLVSPNEPCLVVIEGHVARTGSSIKSREFTRINLERIIVRNYSAHQKWDDMAPLGVCGHLNCYMSNRDARKILDLVEPKGLIRTIGEVTMYRRSDGSQDLSVKLHIRSPIEQYILEMEKLVENYTVHCATSGIVGSAKIKRDILYLEKFLDRAIGVHNYVGLQMRFDEAKRRFTDAIEQFESVRDEMKEKLADGQE